MSGTTGAVGSNSSLVARPIEGITEKVSDWKPVINPVQDLTADGRPMEGIAYPEHSALGLSLDSGLRAGMSSLEPLQQSVLNTSLVVRRKAEIRTSDWKPVINTVQDITPDGRPMEGTAYPEHSALGVSLDSGLRAGMSSIEPVLQSVFNTLSVARPEAELTKETTDWEPVADPVPGTTLDGRLREGNTYPEHSALEVSLDSGPMEGNTRSVTRPDGGNIKKFANWDAVAHPVPDINLDGRRMEGNTYLEPSALGVSLDSGLMEGMSRPEPLEQSVLGALSVVRPDETDMPERPALESQMNHEQSRFKSSARLMLDPDQVYNADVNADVNTDLPENSAPMMNLEIGRAVVSAGKRCPGSSPHGGNNCSTSGRVVGPRAGLRQWTRGIFARFETVRTCGSDPC